MATDFDDFEGYSTGSAPTGWTERWDSSSSFTVETGGDGKVLEYNTGTTYCLISYDALDSDANRDDFELLGKYQTSIVSVYNRPLVGRASGTGSTETGYYFAFRDSSRRTYKIESGTIGLIQSQSDTLSASTWYWIRFRVNGTSVQAKIWADGGSEPGSWQLDTTNSDISAAGWLGAMGGSGDQVFDQIGFGTNGDTAPSAAAGGGTTLSGIAGLVEYLGTQASFEKILAKSISAPPGRLIYNGTAATLQTVLAKTLSGIPGLEEYQGTVAVVETGQSRTLNAPAGLIQYAGTVASLATVLAKSISAPAGRVIYNGTVAALVLDGEVLATASAPHGVVLYKGTQASLELHKTLSALAGQVTYAGTQATLSTLTKDGPWVEIDESTGDWTEISAGSNGWTEI